MTIEEAYPEAAAILEAAGWKPHDVWQVYTRGTLVMGLEPSGRAFHVKNWGMDIHGPDTPDDPVEAAQWLVARFAEPAQIPVHETDSVVIAEETPVAGPPADDGGVLKGNAGGAAALDAEAEAAVAVQPDSADEGGVGAAAEGLQPVDEGAAGGVPDGAAGEPEPGPAIDAAFDEIAAEGADLDPLALPAPDPADFDPDEIDLGAEILDADSPSFIFGPPADDTEALRSQRIGDVVRIALEKMPTISEADDAALRELRNFAMGVSEGRWPNDADKQAALETLEAVVSLQRLVEAERDARVAFLVTADRPALDAFKAEEGWP